MDSGRVVLQVFRRKFEELRQEYVAMGRGEEFDRQVAHLKRDGRFPFDN